MDIEKLTDQNPWWKDKDLINKDYDIQKWEEKKYKWIPDIINKIELKPFSLHIILGPRQVGKTTIAKLLIRKLCKTQNPRSVFYFNCETAGNNKELIDILETYLFFKDENNIDNSIIILDEVTSPKEWYKAIKYLIDLGKLKNETIILTGSTSISIKKQVELFPGRRGNGKDFTIMPLSFREFVGVLDPDLLADIPKIKKFNELSNKAVKILPFQKELSKLLLLYMEYGGFPLGISEINGNKEEAKRAYLSWIRNAVLKADRSDLIARQIIKALLEKLPSPISWEKISKEIEIKSPKTVSSYVDLLKSSFVLDILYNLDLSKKTLEFGKNKKIHFIDPLLIELFEDWCLIKLKNKQNIIAESLVATTLCKKFKDNTFFWRNGTEIDVLVIENNALFGFEVKWGKNSDIKYPAQVKNLITITKNEFSQKPLKIPISVFLAILE